MPVFLLSEKRQVNAAPLCRHAHKCHQSMCSFSMLVHPDWKRDEAETSWAPTLLHTHTTHIPLPPPPRPSLSLSLTHSRTHTDTHMRSWSAAPSMPVACIAPILIAWCERSCYARGARAHCSWCKCKKCPMCSPTASELPAMSYGSSRAGSQGGGRPEGMPNSARGGGGSRGGSGAGAGRGNLAGRGGGLGGAGGLGGGLGRGSPNGGTTTGRGSGTRLFGTDAST